MGNITIGGSKKAKTEQARIQSETRLGEVGDQIRNISRRYYQMEENFKKVDADLDERDSTWDTEIAKSVEELDRLKKEVELMLDNSSKAIVMMEKIIVRFKDAAKKTDHEETKTRLDSWRVEDLITKDRFKKIFLKELEKRIE